MSLDAGDNDAEALGAALRRLRERAGLTQQQLAEHARSDHTYVSRVERGRIDVGWTVLLRYLRAMDASLIDLEAELQRR
jgi:transcriptional regulator with XRE-family HTH domain